MRYFFLLPNPEPPLASRVVEAALACQTVVRAGSMQALFASDFGALTGAVDVTPVAVTTDKDLAVAIAAGTVVKTGTGQHRHKKADEGWIYTCLGVTLCTGCAKARFGAWRRF